MDESDYVFLQGNRLKDRFLALPPNSSFHIAELGFGTGLNFLLTAELFLKAAPPDARLFFTSVEKHPITPVDLARVYGGWPRFAGITEDILRQYPPMVAGFHSLFLAGGRIRLTLCLGDAADILPEMSGPVDAWYLDGFSPAKNPDMWRPEFYPQIAALTGPGGTLATFSVTGPMRRAFAAEGFTVEKIKGYGIKWSMTVAQKNGSPASRARKKIAVLGAGIAGCAAARMLALRGHDVMVIERHDHPASEASGNPVAVMYPKMTAAPSPKNTLHTQGFCHARALLTAMRVASWTACGVRLLNTAPDDAARHRAIVDHHGLPGDFARAEDDGLLLPLAGHVQPRDFCGALLDHPSIQRQFGQDLTDIAALAADYDAIVIALGHHSKNFDETNWLPLQSLRGQVTFAAATAESAALAEVLCHDGYITPAVAGTHSLGATFQKEEPDDGATRADDDAENIAQLNAHLPQLGLGMAQVTGSRAAFRTTTPDKMPMAGPCPDYAATVTAQSALRQGQETPAVDTYHEKLFLMTGFGAHGFSTATLAGDVLAAMMSQEPLPVPRSLVPHLLPERFILRDLKRKKI